MKAATWCGTKKIVVEEVDEPRILNPHDAIVRITLTAICGSDLHLYDGYIPTMEQGDILGHEFMGEVVEVGSEVYTLRAGDRVVVPFTISCGRCWYCDKGLYSACDNTNPNAWMQEKAYGQGGAGIYGYSHMLGGFAGGQAQYARVPFADVGPVKVPDGLRDEQVLFLSDIFPTGYAAAENCNIHPGDIVAIWGAGPVAQFAIRSAFMLGAERVIAIDRIPERLEMAEQNGAEIVDYSEDDVYHKLMDMTAGRGPDSCIDAVGLEAHGTTVDAVYDRVKAATMLATDRIHALRQAIESIRKCGTLSIPGVYGGVADKFPIGAVFGKGITIRTGQTHMQRYMRPLLDRVQRGDIDPSFVITHRFPLEEAADAYALFSERRDGCIKVVLQP
jgi:threonine dehydrogenase-like Zn-dependent dehydrogenase